MGSYASMSVAPPAYNKTDRAYRPATLSRRVKKVLAHLPSIMRWSNSHGTSCYRSPNTTSTHERSRGRSAGRGIIYDDTRILRRTQTRVFHTQPTDVLSLHDMSIDNDYRNYAHIQSTTYSVHEDDVISAEMYGDDGHHRYCSPPPLYSDVSAASRGSSSLGRWIKQKYEENKWCDTLIMWVVIGASVVLVVAGVVLIIVLLV